MGGTGARPHLVPCAAARPQLWAELAGSVLWRRFACEAWQLLGANCGCPQRLLPFLFLLLLIGIFFLWVYFPLFLQTDPIGPGGGRCFFFVRVTFSSIVFKLPDLNLPEQMQKELFVFVCVCVLCELRDKKKPTHF